MVIDNKTEKHITELLKHCIKNNSTGFNLEANINEGRRYRISFTFELLEDEFIGIEEVSDN